MIDLSDGLRRHLATFALLLATLAVSAGANAQTDTARATDPAQVEALIGTLEDPAARARLVADLRTLLAAQQDGTVTPVRRSPVVEAMQVLSQRVASFARGLVTVGRGLNALPEALAIITTRLGDPQGRDELRTLAIDMVVAIAAAYVAFWLALRLIAPARRPLAERPASGPVTRVLQPLAGLLLGLLPVAAFGAAGYLTLGLLGPTETPRLVALAWINAGIGVRLLMQSGRTLFAARSPNLRLLPATDENAAYGEVWLRRLSLTGLYGYFGLETALLLGLSGDAHSALLRLLGLVMAGLLVVLVLQTRQAMADLVRGRGDEGSTGLRALRGQVARLWHLIAIFYIAVLYVVWAIDLPGGFLYILRGTGASLLVLLVARLLHRLVQQYFRRGLRVPEELQRRFPGIDKRADRYLSVLQTAARLLIAGLVVVALLQSWQLDALGWLTSEAGRSLGQVLARVLAIVVASALVWELASTATESWLAERTGDDGSVSVPSARARTLLSVGRNALLLVIVTVSTLMVLSELGINIGPMLAGAGVLGLAIGFGSQQLVKDVVTGVFILIENLIEVGDVVTVGGETGVCEAITIRTVRLRSVEGTIHTIPYSSIGTVSNLTREFSYYVMDIGVAYREDTDEVVQALATLGEEFQTDETHGPSLLGPLEVLGVQALADSAVIIRARLKTIPGKQWATGREFNRRMKKRFDELGIEIPFPHTTVYFGEGKDGRAPAAHLRMEPQPETG